MSGNLPDTTNSRIIWPDIRSIPTWFDMRVLTYFRAGPVWCDPTPTVPTLSPRGTASAPPPPPATTTPAYSPPPPATATLAYSPTPAAAATSTPVMISLSRTATFFRMKRRRSTWRLRSHPPHRGGSGAH